VILVAACPDFPGHARRVAAPLCPACVVDPIDALLVAGWAPVTTRAGGLWRDPADGELRTEAHALRLVRKDAGATAERAP
jgi:hypothetical protein